MALCKHCGMESSDVDTCEWCKRPLVPQAPTAGPAPPPLVRTTMDLVEEDEENLRKARTTFFIAGSVLLIAASCVILWKPPFFVWVTVASAFIAAMMLTHWRVIEPFSDDWVIVLILLLLTSMVPGFFVLLGYVLYGLISRNLDSNVVWLYGTYVVVTTVLVIVGILAWPHGVPLSAVLKVYGTQLLSFGAIVIGWNYASSMATGGR